MIRIRYKVYRHSRRACTDLYINLNMMRLMRVYVRTVVTTYVRLFIGCWSDGMICELVELYSHINVDMCFGLKNQNNVQSFKYYVNFYLCAI